MKAEGCIQNGSSLSFSIRQGDRRAGPRIKQRIRASQIRLQMSMSSSFRITIPLAASAPPPLLCSHLRLKGGDKLIEIKLSVTIRVYRLDDASYDTQQIPATVKKL